MVEDKAKDKDTGKGKVTLVGAGPGDPELLTIKAYKALCEAEVVIYDRLVNKDLLAHTPTGCELIYAGKRKHLHTLSQMQINALLLRHANQGRKVVRLKGGDAFVFGRGGEEAEALSAAGIPWEVIPGITAGIGAAASVGLPLTHRDHAQALTLITAHRRHGQLDLDWTLATRPRQTVVFYMATSIAHELVRGLFERGVSNSSYLSVIVDATLPTETLQTYTVATFLAEQPKVNAPAVLVLHPTPIISQADDLVDILRETQVWGGDHEDHEYRHSKLDGIFG